MKFHLKAHMVQNPLFFATFTDTELYQHAPLDIKEARSEKDFSSYNAKWSNFLSAEPYLITTLT